MGRPQGPPEKLLIEKVAAISRIGPSEPQLTYLNRQAVKPHARS